MSDDIVERHLQDDEKKKVLVFEVLVHGKKESYYLNEIGSKMLEILSDKFDEDEPFVLSCKKVKRFI